MRFDYFYGGQSEQFQFYRIPRRLIHGKEFHCLSTDAKLLYGLMLDRMGLSAKNGWYDDLGRVFIYYTLEEIKEDLNCGHDKALKMLGELDTAKGIGLIERVRQGQGKPTRIYVRQFTTTDVPQHSEDVPELPINSRSPEFGKTEVMSSDFPKSGVPNSRSLDFAKTESSYTDRIYPEKNHTDPSIYPSCRPPNREACRCRLMDQIDSAQLFSMYGENEVSTIVELMTDMLCSTQTTIRIGGADLPLRVVLERFQMLNRFHVEYVLDCMKATHSKIRNIRGYLLTALYNAPVTMEQYYQAAVQHDLYG